MKTILIILALSLSLITCKTYYDLDEHKGAIVKYKYVDTEKGWIEVGIQEGRKSYLIYVPIDCDSLFKVNDTIK